MSTSEETALAAVAEATRNLEQSLNLAAKLGLNLYVEVIQTSAYAGAPGRITQIRVERITRVAG